MGCHLTSKLTLYFRLSPNDEARIMKALDKNGIYLFFFFGFVFVFWFVCLFFIFLFCLFVCLFLFNSIENYNINLQQTFHLILPRMCFILWSFVTAS